MRARERRSHFEWLTEGCLDERKSGVDALEFALYPWGACSSAFRRSHIALQDIRDEFGQGDTLLLRFV